MVYLASCWAKAHSHSLSLFSFSLCLLVSLSLCLCLSSFLPFSLYLALCSVRASSLYFSVFSSVLYCLSTLCINSCYLVMYLLSLKYIICSIFHLCDPEDSQKSKEGRKKLFVYAYLGPAMIAIIVAIELVPSYASYVKYSKYQPCHSYHISHSHIWFSWCSTDFLEDAWTSQSCCWRHKPEPIWGNACAYTSLGSNRANLSVRQVPTQSTSYSNPAVAVAAQPTMNVTNDSLSSTQQAQHDMSDTTRMMTMICISLIFSGFLKKENELYRKHLLPYPDRK